MNQIYVSSMSKRERSVAIGCYERTTAKIESKSEFPVVVIGGGLGGLSAAAHLAQNGFPVTLVEQHDIPGLSSMIDVMEAATPLTNISYTSNPEGAIYGYEQSLDNAYMTRLDQRTPVKGLYLASAWTKPGGGYQPCLQSGADAFKALIKDLVDK